MVKHKASIFEGYYTHIYMYSSNVKRASVVLTQDFKIKSSHIHVSLFEQLC